LHFVHPVAYTPSLNVCWALNHQNLIEMAQGHISLSTSPISILSRRAQPKAVEANATMELKLKMTI
jgi:hypothetical protein